MTRRTHEHLILPGGVALVASVVALAAFGLQTVEHGDAPDYLVAADAILSGDPYPRDVPGQFFFRPPGYPAVIAALWAVFGQNVEVLKVANVVAHVVTVCFVSFLGTHAARDRRVGVLAGAIYALHPFALRYVVDVQTEPVFTALVAASVTGAYLAACRSERAWLPALWGGAAFGAAALTRPSALAVVIVVAAAIWGVRGLRHGLAPTVLVVAALVVVAPWTWTNWRATGDLIPVADGLGYHLWIGNHPEVLRLYEGDFASRQEFDRFNHPHLLVNLPSAQVDRWEVTGIAYWDLSVGERDRLWRRDAIARIATDPATTVKLWAWKTWGLWRPWLFAGYYPPAWVLTSGLALTGLYVGAAVGAVRLWHRPGRGRTLVVLLGAVFLAVTAAHVATHVLLRFRVPYVDPYVIVLASVAAVGVTSRRWGGDADAA